MNQEKQIKLSPPWIEFYKKIQLLFKEDEQVTVSFDENKYILSITVKGNEEKAKALRKLFPTERLFGNIAVRIKIFTTKIKTKKNILLEEILAKAFENNPVVEAIITSSDTLRDDQTYILFKNEVVQFFNDDIYDYNGVCSTLYQDIAKDVLKDFTNVHYCTSTNINENENTNLTSLTSFNEESDNKKSYDSLAEIIEAFWYGY